MDEPEETWAPRPTTNDETKVWTGKLFRGEGADTVRGFLFQQRTNARFEFTGSRDPRAGGYLLIARRVR